MKPAVLVALTTLMAGPAAAVELRAVEVRRGTEGLQPAPLTIRNATEAPIVCIGELAHWYSAELASIDADAKTEIALWFDPQTGTYSALNQADENMPVERLWCGRAGLAYETRAPIALRREAGATASPTVLTCTMEDTRLACE